MLYVNDMPQAVRSTLLLYEDDSCILYQSREVDEIEKQLNKGYKQNKWEIGKIDISQKSFAECFAMLLFSRNLITRVQSGTLISKRK